MGSLFGKKTKRRRPVRSTPPATGARIRAPPPQLLEVKRRFSSMKTAALMYAVIGAAVAGIAAAVVSFMAPSMPGLALAAAVATAMVFTYLSVMQAVNAYSYYLYMRLKLDLSGKVEAAVKQPGEVQAMPVQQPPPVPVQASLVTRPAVPPSPVKPVEQPVEVAKPVIVQKPATKPEEEKSVEPVIEIKEAPAQLEKVEPEKPAFVKQQAPISLQQASLQPASPPTATVTTPAAPAVQPTVATEQSGGKKRCPYCGRELPYGDLHVICPYCGRRLK